jgi:Zn-dependent protease with chaperone function
MKFGFSLLLTLSLLCKTQEPSALQPDVSKTTHQFVDAILKPYGLDHIFDQIKNFSQQQLKENPLLNIAVGGSKNDGYCLLINESWFSNLDDKVRQFLIMHEVMHIKLGHIDSPDLDLTSNKDMIMSRQRELDADLYAVKLLNSNKGALSFFNQMRNYTVMSSHPTWEKRIDAIKNAILEQFS